MKDEKTTKPALKPDRFQLNIEMPPNFKALKSELQLIAIAERKTLSEVCTEALQNHARRNLKSALAAFSNMASTSTRLGLKCAVSSAAERLLDTQEAAGSTPARRTNPPTGRLPAANGRDECSARGVGIAILRECGLSVQNNGVGEPP